MELWLWAAAFTAWQCLVRLPAHAEAVFTLWPFGWLRARGPGFRLPAPWPGARGWVASDLPLEITARAIYVDDPDADGAHERCIALGGGNPIEARGKEVFEGDTRVLRFTLPAEAARFAALVAELRALGTAERERAVDAQLARALSAASCRAAWSEARAATRWLRAACF